MEYKQTKHQVARTTRPDAEMIDKLLLFKRTSELRATYQIRLLAYRAVKEGRKLVIEIPEKCSIHPNIRKLILEYPDDVMIART